MNDWWDTLEGLRGQVWTQLAQAAQSRALISLGTTSPAGDPEVRTVVLRAADQQTGVLEIYTDLQSDKITSLQHRPRASILHWHDPDQLQIRATCDVTILTGQAVMDRWRAIPDHSKLSYGMTPPPGQTIPNGTAYTKVPDPDVFAVLSCTVTHIDAVYLGTPHRRAAFKRADVSQGGDWAANWLAP